MSTINVNSIDKESGSTLTLGTSGTTISIPSGATITNSGTATGFGGDNTPSFAAYNNASQSISSGTWTKLIYNTESWDTDSAFDSSTNYRWTPGEAGKYLIWANSYLSNATYGDCKLYLYVNGSEASPGIRYAMKQADGSGTELISFVSLSATDYVEMYFYAHAGTAITEANKSHFGGFKLVGV